MLIRLTDAQSDRRLLIRLEFGDGFRISVLGVPFDTELTPRVTTFTLYTGPAPNPASGSATVGKNTQRAN